MERRLPDPPPRAADAPTAVAQGDFRLPLGLVEAQFHRRSDELWVTFDNLGSVGAYDPPQPWLQARAAKAGVSILGLMASRKDWYRNADTPRLVGALHEAGLFAGFRRITFIGASMGGFAALVHAPLVPGAGVLAFSPQSTLAKKRARFDKRYRYAQKTWDWDSPDFLDAAEAMAGGLRATVVFDPFVPEDHAHLRRMAGPGLTEIRVPHLGHRAIRNLKGLGLLDALIEDVAAGRFDPVAFARAFRDARRADLSWRRAAFAEAERRGHAGLLPGAIAALRAREGDSPFLRRASRRLAERSPALPGQGGEIRVTAGDPQPPFAGLILDLPGALVVPERDHDDKLASGVLQADGQWCALSEAWIRAAKSTPAPRLAPDEPVTDLPGTHLFAGHFRGHFGHFLVESTARLWALPHLPVRPDSILYLPYRGDARAVERAIEGHRDFFRLMGIDMPVRTHAGALRVERLFVPELGFGWKERYAGSPAYRAVFRDRLSAAVPAEGGERLYISRARLNAQRGGILGETVIEENLARAGFEIFHPERHPLATQIARYKAARQIVGLDGSAFHLAAYVLAPEAQVTMILRRSKANVADYDLQFRSFAGVTPRVIDAIRRDWVAEDSTRVDFRSVGEVDFVRLFDRLAALGHLPPGFVPDLPDAAAIAEMLAEFGERRGQPMRALKPGERHLDEDQ